ncbi:MAG TPA: antibiotic biosynthesis monooxygenase [Mycobacteriales bacterium]|nr:antibiotic biosynthesis monooxygenase [Mycobacteriales bacterium]
MDALGWQPQVAQVVTVFRSRLRPDAAGYHEHAERMSELARTMPGYVEHKTFTADDGERVTVVTFADRASHDAWRRNDDHRDAQRSGIRDYYASYTIQTGVVDRVRVFPAD